MGYRNSLEIRAHGHILVSWQMSSLSFFFSFTYFSYSFWDFSCIFSFHLFIFGVFIFIIFISLMIFSIHLFFFYKFISFHFSIISFISYFYPFGSPFLLLPSFGSFHLFSWFSDLCSHHFSLLFSCHYSSIAGCWRFYWKLTIIGIQLYQL